MMSKDFIVNIDATDAYENFRYRGARDFKYPSKKDQRFRDEMLFPHIKPKFKVKKHDTIFTIGSCFARNIEKKLLSNSFTVPVASYFVPKSEFPWAAPHILNEYTLATMHQRIASVLGEFSYDDRSGIIEQDGLFQDLFLHRSCMPTTVERLVGRRREIDDLYKKIIGCDLCIITLGLVEAWYDSKYDCYLNSAPSKLKLSNESKRYFFRRINHRYCVDKLNDIIAMLKRLSVKNILLTVSPVPIEVSFTKDDVVIANCYSKSVLRSCIEEILEEHQDVDYFPSYEIVTSGGAFNMMDDNVHVREDVVNKVTDYMIGSYID